MIDSNVNLKVSKTRKEELFENYRSSDSQESSEEKTYASTSSADDFEKKKKKMITESIKQRLLTIIVFLLLTAKVTRSSRFTEKNCIIFLKRFRQFCRRYEFEKNESVVKFLSEYCERKIEN